MSTVEEKDKKSYELGFLIDSEEDFAHVIKMLKESGVDVTFESPLQKVSLAYPIKKRITAHFGYVYFDADPSVAPKIEAGLRLDKKFVRFILLSPIIISKPAPTGGYRGQKTRPEQPLEKPIQEEKHREAEKQPVLSNEALEKTLEEILK